MRPSPPAKTQQWLRAAILLIGGFTLLAFLFADPILRGLHRRDLGGAVPQQGVATVVTLVPPRPQATGAPEPALVGVRFRAGIYTATRVIDAERLRLGGEARITYRVGRSGRIYVDAVAPTP